MKNISRTIARELCPPVLVRAARLFLKKNEPEAQRPVGFFGNYKSFDEALEECGDDYQTDAILEITRKNTAAIQTREKVEISPVLSPFLTSFFLAASELGKDEIRVLDYGGAMGAHYLHARRLLPPRYRLRWTVVDLPRTAAIGAAEFGSDELSFSDQLDPAAPFDVVLASCVFQVLRSPYETIDSLLSMNASHFIFPLIPLIDADDDRLTIEYVTPTIAPISIPHWFFARGKMEQTLSRRKELAAWRHAEYTNPLDGKPCEYFGFHLTR
ncbi:methyltransferase, TIGR04325 family [Rhizobium leguminosarum]|uniref:methyltransferase, TIGR04325 family n=1 Tax=Rhizobium leguminosarum TaxID=384 RepID=UPI001C95A985|nr:methyltransferase, TIGR04325 family [Rhizobium leguminosarum]MBY5796448.1 methyltransferase, TIGR04325 family [Rhizobium leguminosarum]